MKNNSNHFTIYKGISNDLTLSCPKLKYDKIPIRIEDTDKIKVFISCNTNLIAPVFKDEKVGSLSVMINNDLRYSLDICSKNSIDKKEIIDYIKLFFKSFYNYTNFINMF